MEELPDLDASGAVAGTEFYNAAGDMRRFIPGTQQYETAMSGEGEYYLLKKPDKFAVRTVYKENEEMKKTLEFIRTKAKNRRSRGDMFDRTISDIMKYDHVVNDMMGNLIKDHKENKLEESTLSLMKAKNN